LTEISVVDYHAGGEPFRIVTGGVEPLLGESILARRRDALERLDHVRRLLVYEPRGHADMYGCHVVPGNDAGADLGVVFFHNAGYSTACGHGTIALVTWALDEGVVERHEGENRVVVDVPSGRVETWATVRGGRVRSVRFRNVPSFVWATDLSAGPFVADIAFGGAFYASLEVRTAGLSVSPAALPELIALQRELRAILDRSIEMVHPDEPELRGLYGIIFWQPIDDEARLAQRNVTVFADGEVDRSPCGSGTSARLAILHDRGEIATGQTLHHRSIVDSAFDARVTGAGPVIGGYPSVVTEVEGSAFATGRHTFTLDERDPLRAGFLLR
jgi:proline racemase